MALSPLKNTISLALIITIFICSFPTSLLAQSVSDIVTQSFFDGILDKADASCAGKNFYTRAAFLSAIGTFPEFGTSGSSDDNKREIAAFFAHVSHETGNMCDIKEKDWTASNKVYCDDKSTPEAAKYPCTPGKKYYGRGPLQLTWNYNYGGAGQKLNFDGLNNPEMVATDVDTSFKASMWYWMTNVHSVINQGFGATINVINSRECNGKDPDKVKSRVQFYQTYCTAFRVDPGNKLSC